MVAWVLVDSRMLGWIELVAEEWLNCQCLLTWLVSGCLVDRMWLDEEGVYNRSIRLIISQTTLGGWGLMR